jgi:uncharacterized protein YndB with AHSA1/START domain
MPTWWPLTRFSVSAYSGKPPKSLRVEPKVGGKIVEQAHDGTEHLWGTIRAYDPHDYLRMDFHMTMPAESTSHVEVRFTSLGANRTRVVLTQSHWEGFGAMAEMNRKGYGTAWGIIFEQAYKAACGG